MENHIEHWNGHRVLAVPATTRTLARLVQLRKDLGFARGRMRACCALCPAWDATKSGGCTNPKRDLAPEQGGCRRHFVIAEEYMPLVQMRLGALL